MPGSLNSVQGWVTIDGQTASPGPIRQEALRTGQKITTRRHANAELLLTPGSFLRIGNRSSVQMISRSLGNATVRLVRGSALLDANANFKHELAVDMDGTRTRIEKKGLYRFNANQQTIAVLRGRANVYESDSRVVLKGKRELYISGGSPMQVRKLNVRAFKSSSLYQWSGVRNRYEADARKSVRESIAQSGRWYGPGWYWSRFWGTYAYVPSASAYIGPYYASPYYGAWGGNDWGGGWGWGGWGDDDD